MKQGEYIKNSGSFGRSVNGVNQIESAIREVVRDAVLALPVKVAVIDADGCIIVTNFSPESVIPCRSQVDGDMAGMPYETLLEIILFDQSDVADARMQIRQVLSEDAECLSRTYCLASCPPTTLLLHAMRLAVDHDLTVITFVTMPQDPKQAVSRRTQQARILHAQGEERRRIARDLHDGTAQELALAQMMLETVRRAGSSKEFDAACIDVEGALSAAQRQVRTMSYLLHPPEISAGLADALSTFLKGFSRRTGLNAVFENHAGSIKPSGDLDTAVYRITQEALVNVSKHAFATQVCVRLRSVAKHLILEIEDNGIGISPEIAEGRRRDAVGVGLPGMRERVEALGGSLCVERRLHGTVISASFPRRRAGDA